MAYRVVQEYRAAPVYSAVYSLLSQRRTTGEVLSRVKLNDSARNLGYRVATAGLPARLLTEFHDAGQTTIEERDPQTLAVLDTWTVATPTNYANFYSNFNADSTAFVLPDGRLISTVTREFLPLNAAVKAELANPPRTNGHVSWSPDLQWLQVMTYVPESTFGGAFRYDYVSNSTGAKVSGAPLHSVGCDLSGSAAWGQGIVTLPDGGMALPFGDGVIELRRADNSLRKAVKLGSCAWYGLSVKGNTLQAENDLEAWAINLTDGTATPSTPTPMPAPLPAINPLKVTLNTKAKFVSETSYESAGTATVNGQTFQFSAKATGLGVKFTAQTSPIPQLVTWEGELRRQDGTLYARASGQHAPDVSSQYLNLQLVGVDMGFDLKGPLTRP